MKICFVAFMLVMLFKNTDGQQIQKIKIKSLSNLIATSDSILIINFWATFCKPCVEEIPDLIKFANKYKKQKASLYLVSLDLEDYYPEKIKKFVAKKKYTAKITWLDESNADYFCPIIDTSWSGAIPATLIVNNKMGYKKFYEKQLTSIEIEVAIKAALQKP
jgi:thiol-disulfide isomerase/thioredoxin